MINFINFNINDEYYLLRLDYINAINYNKEVGKIFINYKDDEFISIHDVELEEYENLVKLIGQF